MKIERKRKKTFGHVIVTWLFKKIQAEVFKAIQRLTVCHHLVGFYINTFILITLRCVYIYRERSIIIVNTRSMVVAISIFDTFAFLSSGSPGGISQNIRAHIHAQRRMYKQTGTRFTHPKDYVQFNIDSIRQAHCCNSCYVQNFASVNQRVKVKHKLNTNH